MQRGRRVKFATLATAARTAIAAGIGVVRMVVQFARTDPAAIPVAGGVAIDAAIGWLGLEETDSLGRSVHGRSNVIIATDNRADTRFFSQKRA